MKKIAIYGAKLAPNFNESAAIKINKLSKELDIDVITCNNLNFLPLKKYGKYTILNTYFIDKNIPFLNYLNMAFCYTFFKIYGRRYDTIILTGGMETKFLDILSPKKCVPCIKDLNIKNNKKRRITFLHLRKFKGFIVEINILKRKLIELGISEEKIFILKTGIEKEKIMLTPPPSGDTFRILFASAPIKFVFEQKNFYNKGIKLLLDAFYKFSKDNVSHLTLLWRGHYLSEIQHLIEKIGVRDNLSIVNETINIKEHYESHHITIIPYTNLSGGPNFPLSALESIASGRPVVTTRFGEIAKFVKKYKCGTVAEEY